MDVKPSHITREESEVSKLTKKQVMGNSTKSVTCIETHRISLFLFTRKRHNNDQISVIMLTKSILRKIKSVLKNDINKKYGKS